MPIVTKSDIKPGVILTWQGTQTYTLKVHSVNKWGFYFQGYNSEKTGTFIDWDLLDTWEFMAVDTSHAIT